MDYFIAAIITAFLWGISALTEAQIGKICVKGSLFIKFTIFYILILIFYLFNTHEINNDLKQLWNYNRKNLIIFIISLIFVIAPAQYLYYTSHNESKNRSYIVMAISYTLPIIITTIGAHLFLNEIINLRTLIGIFTILIGVYIMKLDN